MIERIKGIIEIKKLTYIVISLHGIGLKIRMSEKSIESMPHSEEEIVVLTYLHVKEDALDLYGFFSNIERETFLLLITINGIGPKLALTILSGMEPDRLNNYIITGDVKSLTAIPGVGSKTANRIILELKDKVDLNKLKISTGDDNNINQHLYKDSVNALVSLGYKKHVANEACLKLKKNDELKGEIQNVIKKALKINILFQIYFLKKPLGRQYRIYERSNY